MKRTALIAMAVYMIASSLSIAHAKDKKDSVVANFNSGVTLYRDKSYYKAIDSFNRTIASGRSDLIADADYNIANSEYRLGELKEKNQDIKGARELCDMALKFYKRSMDLNPGDKDAKFNYEFVLNKMKDLNEKFQMKNEEKEKEKKQQDKKDKSQQQKDQRSGGGGDQGKEEKQEAGQSGGGQGEPKQGAGQEAKPQEESKEGQQKEGQESERQGKQQQEERLKAEQEGEQQQQEGRQEEQPKEPEPKPEGQQEQPGGAEEKGLEAYQSPQGEEGVQEMSAEEAKMLLEGYKGEEATGKAIRMRKKPISLSEPLKDW